MAKDPAVLIYFDKWIASTNGMKAHLRAWYMDLLFYQYDNPDGIPDDTDFIAGICRILPSEYNLLEQMVEQVLKLKFKLYDGKWKNIFAEEIISKRQDFKQKRAKSGNIGVIIKLAKTIKGFNIKYLARLKDSLFTMTDEEIEQAKNKQVLEQMLKLYINEDVDVNKDINKEEDLNYYFNSETFKNQWKTWKQFRKKSHKFSYFDTESEQCALTELFNLSEEKEENAIKIIKNSISKGWKGFFKIKEDGQSNNNTNSGNNSSYGHTTNSKGGKVSASSILARQARAQYSGDSESGNITVEAEVVE